MENKRGLAATTLLLGLSLARSALGEQAQAARGELLFQTCTACHNVLGNGVGPDLTGIYGQPAAARPGFAYSDALKSSGLVWNDAALRAFIRDPQGAVKGTKMLFPGYPADADVEAVLAYLKQFK